MFFLVSLALANSDGKTGVAQVGCGGCHGSEASSAVSIDLQGPNNVFPGEEIALIAMIITTDATHQSVGLNASASGGTLSAGSNNQLVGGEVTHSSPQALVGGRVGMDFTWTAPDEPGDYTIYIAGNSVNMDGAPSGDGWNTTSLTVTVEATSGDSTNVDPPVVDSTPEDSHEEALKDEPKCGCSSSPEAGGLVLGLGAMLLGLKRRK